MTFFIVTSDLHESDKMKAFKLNYNQIWSLVPLWHDTHFDSRNHNSFVYAGSVSYQVFSVQLHICYTTLWQSISSPLLSVSLPNPIVHVFLIVLTIIYSTTWFRQVGWSQLFFKGTVCCNKIKFAVVQSILLTNLCYKTKIIINPANAWMSVSEQYVT